MITVADESTPRSILERTRIPLKPLTKLPEAQQGISLNFHMQPQERANWCWSATATSVALFYVPTSSWTQCKLANAMFGRNDCCGANGSGPLCNKPGNVGIALTMVGHGGIEWNPVPEKRLMDEINARRPIGIAVLWSNGGGHAFVIGGYTHAAHLGVVFFTNDSLYGRHAATFEGIARYRGGAWIKTYPTIPGRPS